MLRHINCTGFGPNMKLILILIAFIGFCYLEPVREEVKPYVYKCHTDMECQEEEEACLASGECVHQR